MVNRMNKRIIKIPVGASRRVHLTFLEAKKLNYGMEQKYNVQYINLWANREGRKL